MYGCILYILSYISEHIIFQIICWLVFKWINNILSYNEYVAKVICLKDNWLYYGCIFNVLSIISLTQIMLTAKRKWYFVYL